MRGAYSGARIWALCWSRLDGWRHHPVRDLSATERAVVDRERRATIRDALSGIGRAAARFTRHHAFPRVAERSALACRNLPVRLQHCFLEAGKHYRALDSGFHTLADAKQALAHHEDVAHVVQQVGPYHRRSPIIAHAHS